jgi:hypothetical protein
MKKITVFLMVLVLASCSQNRDKGQIVTIDQLNELGVNKENSGKRFSIVGHPFIDRDITVRALGNKSQLPYINFYEQPNGQGKMIGSFPIENGKGKNEFYAPEAFTMDDVVFYDNDGKELKHTDKMQLSFTMDLQTERERMKLGDKMVYFGGPIDIRIDKAQ